MACSPSPNSTNVDSARTALGAVEDVVVFGRNSVRVEPSSAVLGGDIAVEATSGSPYPTSGTLADGARISVGAWSTIGGDVVAATGLFEYGSELVDGNNFDRYAALDGVFYNGLVRGGVSLPMSPPPPAFPTVAPVTPGIGTFTVAAGTSQTLTASTSYEAIVVETGATLYLDTGAHRVATVTTSTNATIIALDRVDLRIADALLLGADSVLTTTTGFSAGDLRVDVAGFNSPPDPLATVRAVDLGDRADVRAIVFAPNGTAWVGEDAVVDGVVFARDVWVDFGATVAFEDGRDPYASDAPVAFSDGYTVSEEETLSVSAPGVLWNDYDPNQDAIVAELVTGTTSGTVALSTDGSFSYTPQMDFTGIDSFTYRVFDGTYYSSTATVTFTVDDEADAPRIVSEPGRFSFVGALWDYTVVATDADTNETFTYALESESPAAATVDSGGVVEWTPASGDEGANVVSLVVTDSDGLETAQVRAIEVTTSPRSEYFALYAIESVQVAGGAIIKGDVGAVQSGSGTFLGSGWWGTARTTVGGYVDGDVFGDTVALDFNASVDDVYTDDLVFDQGTAREDMASLPSMESLAATATAAVSGALVVSTGTTQTLSAGAALATVEVEEDACLELEAGAHLFGSITVREGGCLVAQGPVSVHINATLLLEDGAFIGPAPDVALDADQIQIQIHASNGGAGGPVDTPLPFDSGFASSVHAHVLAPNGTIRLGQSSSNRVSFRGLHVLADIESTITFEGDVDGSFGSAPYFTSTDVTTANVGAEYEYDADAFDADVGDVLTYFLDRRPDGMDIDRNTGEIIWVPGSNQDGDHLVELRVEDLAGNTAVRTFTIVVPLTNQAPSGVADFYRAYEGIPRTLTPAPTLNDDDLLDFVLVTQPANGTVTIESNGDVTYTSNAAFVGTDSFEYRARDPGGLESANTTVSITVFEANDPPVCVDRVYTVDEDTLLDVASVMGLTVGSSDAESDPVSVFVVSPPAHGTLTVSVDGAFTFLPDVEQTQQVTFDFICHDGRAFAAAPSTATINITPLNDAPLVDAGPDRTEPLGTMVALAGDAFDAEGDVMAFAWTFGSVPSGSTAILTGADTPSPTFGTDELGTYNLTLTVTDANGAVDSDSVVITSAPLNRPPEIIEDPVPVARPGRAFNFPTNVNEPDGDTSLTYALVPEPSWLSPFSSTTGTLVGTPTANDLGSYPVAVTVTDPGGLSDTRSYTIEVVADAVPVAVDDTYDAFVDETLTVAAASGVLANDSDADNDALTASVVTPPSTGSLTLAADGSLTYDFALVSSSSITEKYHAYSGTSVISTPMVAHLTDDDADGDIDQDDIPAIVFVTRPSGQQSGGAIVAVRGTDGQVLFTAGGSNDIAALSEIAIGDIDGDGFVEIVAAHRDGDHLMAYEHTGAFKWQSTTDALPGRNDSGGAISIANLDGIGLPEIVVGSSVYDSNGTLLADGRDIGGTRFGFSSFTAISAVADIDLDGTPEIIAGPAVFRFANNTLSLVWQRSDRYDGFVAVGNFDDDPYAEIVISGASLYVLNHDGSDFAPWGSSLAGNGGASTVADLDGDGAAEIGLLHAGAYRVFESDGTERWSQVVDDASESTGSTVFDFDLDGEAEIVYSDEEDLWIFRGADGAILTRLPLRSGTGTEQPTIADVDGDGFAELVVAADTLAGGGTYDTGIHVFEGAPNEWAPTRSIWNQHSYHVTNVNDDGTIPLVEATNWLAPGLNNFRLNTLEPGTHTDSFTYRANDGAQDSDVATVTITIRPPNTAPTITSDLPLTAYVGVPYEQPLLAVDPDLGDTVTWSSPDSPFVSFLTNPDRMTWTATTAQIGSLMITLRAQDAQGAYTLRPYTFQVSTPQATTVPDVVGLVQATATSDVEAVGLSTSLTFATDSVVPAGTVVSQSPSGGASATQGDVVALVVSTGPAQITVPDVVGLAEASASADVVSAGLTVGATSQAPHPTVAAGSVSAQTPAAGAVVSEGTAVDLVVSQGVVVPNVVGVADQTAVSSIAAAGLTIGSVQFMVDAAAAGTVAAQAPVGGTSATANDPVDLVVSLGPQYTTVSVVVGALQQDAVDALIAADLVVGQIQLVASTSIPSGRVVASTPAGGTVVAELTSVDLLVSSGAPSVVVPDVVGLTTTAAANALTAVQLGGSFTGEPHPTAPAGEVVEQTPSAGTSVSEGVVVALVVSVGPASATVPNVVGLQQTAAESSITAASLTSGATQVYHPTIAIGTVLTQDPEGGSVVADGSLVALEVSHGPAPATVPNVTGLTLAAANTAVSAAGLVAASSYAADAAPVDTVVSQSPAAGTSVSDGSTVSLVISSGASPEALPHVVGFLEADASARIVADGFAVGTVTQATSSSVPAGRVAAQTPPGGALRPSGSNVDLVVSSGPPVATVPNVVGLAELHAISELTTAGFTTGAIVAQHSNVTPYGLVSLQAPGAGVSVEQGSAVDLTISLGPEPDTTAPRVVVDIQPPFIVLGNTVTITVTVTGETLPVTTEVAVNGVPQTVSSGTVTVTPSASGPQVVAVNVTDASGNETALTRYFGVDVAGDVTAPTASITTPANADVITEPTPVVGTATDANLLYYELSYRSASDDTFTTIVTSPLGVTADELGVFDPTLLENGLYTLRLEAVDVGGRTSTDEVSVHVDGNMKVGVFTLSFVDLAIPLTGIPITVTRTYDSRVKRTEDFGVGWSLDVAAGRYENNRPLSEGWSITQSAPPGAQACGNQDDLAQYRTTEIRLSDQEYYTFAPYIVAAYPSFGSCYVQVAFSATGGSAPGAVLGIVGNDFAVNPSGPAICSTTSPDCPSRSLGCASRPTTGAPSTSTRTTASCGWRIATGTRCS